MAKIRRNDTVFVLTGKDRGKRGKVQQVLPKEQRVLVEGINVVKRHVKPRPPVVQGGIVSQERPIHISNVALLCPHCGKPTRAGFRFLEDGTKVRFCKQCSQVID
ncbi:MAG: 50S ribosomal protein L24 [Chloroflexi bacterium]|nr:50S ribosomal protein L24 [Chloroflexota bacterium]